MKEIQITVVTAFTSMASTSDSEVTDSLEGVIQYQMEMSNTPGCRLIQDVVRENRIPNRMYFAFLFMEQDKVVKQDTELFKKLYEITKVQLKGADVGV
jgi:hypothetical protein